MWRIIGGIILAIDRALTFIASVLVLLFLIGCIASVGLILISVAINIVASYCGFGKVL